MTNDPIIFNRKRVRLHRERAVRLGGDDFLLKEMAQRVCERLDELNKKFPMVLDVGAHAGTLAKKLTGRSDIGILVQTDLSYGMLSKASGLRVVADEELIPFAENSFDMCITIGSLQWVNDLPGALVQIRRVLKPGGAFIAIIPGGETLKELRQSFEKAEMEISGGISPRISPFVDAREVGSLLTRAGFSHPVIDTELLNVEYEHPLKLLKELRAMGETNALIHSQKNLTPCSVVMTMADHYMRNFLNESERINATFELVTMTAWRD
ncbi:MAG: methyltransferase domain-containing protein [Alphaproteobacteria bacterium]